MGYKKPINFAISLHAKEGKSFQLFMIFLREKYKNTVVDISSVESIVLDPTFPYKVIESEEINMESNYGFVKFCLYFVFNAHKKEFTKWLEQLKEAKDDGKEKQSEPN